MKKLFLVLAGSIFLTTPVFAHKVSIHDPPRAHRPRVATRRVGHRHHFHGVTHRHCHYHDRYGYSHCHKHSHNGPGRGHHGKKWYHGVPYDPLHFQIFFN